MIGHGLARVLLALVSLAGCATAAGRIENGMFHSAKGYRVTLPPAGWRVDAGQRADLALRGEARPGGMVVDATCSGRESTRPLDVLATIYDHLGIDAKKQYLNDAGRPISVLPGGEPIKELF